MNTLAEARKDRLVTVPTVLTVFWFALWIADPSTERLIVTHIWLAAACLERRW